MILNYCQDCGKPMCATCINDAGAECTCLLADDKEINMTNFKPTPVDAKRITFGKAQKKVVKTGAERVQKQDQAMWFALTDSASQKCLLAITICAGMFHAATGYSTSFFDPSCSYHKIKRGGRERGPLGNLHPRALLH